MRRIASKSAHSRLAINVRHFEYWGLGITSRTQPYARGDKLTQMANQHGGEEVDVQSQYVSGNGMVPSWDSNMLTDRDAELNAMRAKGVFWSGHTKWVVDPVATKDVQVVSELFASLDKSTVWNTLFKLFPSLRQPLDDATQKEFEAFYQQLFEACADEEQCAAVAAPFVLKMTETKYISQPYWWRIAEAVIEALAAHNAFATPFAGRAYANRCIHIVVERATKISYNTMNDWSWASDDMVSPLFFDVTGHRGTHESGHW